MKNKLILSLTSLLLMISALAHADDEYDYNSLVVAVYNNSEAKLCWMANKAFASTVKSKLGKSDYTLEVSPYKGMKDPAYPDNEVGILMINKNNIDSSFSVTARVNGRPVRFGTDVLDTVNNEKGGYIWIRYWVKGVEGPNTPVCETDFFAQMGK